MKMVLASNNAGKLAELQTMFGTLQVQLVRQSELNISEAAEPYKTFVENALAKARHAAEQSGLPAVADDAGLSTLVAVRSAYDPEPLIAVGRVVVDIAREPLGDNGFGFDPVLFLPEFGKTFAQLPVEVKNANSHRGRSSQAMVALMRERWGL